MLICHSRRQACPATCPHLPAPSRQATGYGCFIAAGAASILAAFQALKKRRPAWQHRGQVENQERVAR